MTPSRIARPLRVAVGIVAYGDEERLETALHSLTSQVLPPDAEWSGFWLVVSPGRDRTMEIARRLSAANPRVHLFEEPSRRGKSAAIAEVMARAKGDVLVLMNGDARAEAGAVAALLEAIPVPDQPYAVMARPTPSTHGSVPLDRAVALLWDVHHAFHREVIGSGRGTHLSDELMLLPMDRLPPMSEGIITDGAYIGSWVAEQRGSLIYAERARVAVTVPASLREHLVQRRRIHRGHRQIGHLTGRYPTTLQRWGARHPFDGVRLVLRAARGHPRRLSSLAALVTVESLASLLAMWDIAIRSSEPVAWERIQGRPWEPIAGVTREEPAR